MWLTVQLRDKRQGQEACRICLFQRSRTNSTEPERMQIEVATTLFNRVLLNRVRSETNYTWSMGTAPDGQLCSARAHENRALK